MTYTWINNVGEKDLLCDGRRIGAISPFVADGIVSEDIITEIEPGVFRWVRTFSASRPISARLTMDFTAAYRSDYSMIPAVSYNGNEWGTGHDPKGFIKDGQPWSFAYHRCAVAGATYSENAEWSVALFGMLGPDGVGFSCSLMPEADHTIHRLIWPEEEMPLVYSDRDRYTEGFSGTIEIKPETPFTATAFLVVEPVGVTRTAFRRFLDIAWKANYHAQTPALSPARAWELGIRYAKENLWAEEGIFRGFSIGLLWYDDNWEQRRGWKYEIGWCGQNLSLANALLHDYLMTGDQSSLDKGLAALDTWATHGRLPSGLIRCHFDYILGIETNREVLDACNLGGAACAFFEADRLAEKCGISRPQYRKTAFGICDFALKSQREDGRFGKAWSCDGECIDPNGTIGAFLIPPLIEAYRLTGEKRYLESAERAYRYYITGLLSDGFTTAGALDTHCIDKESATPLLDSAISLFEITGKPGYLQQAENAAYYLASWQWHHTVPYPEGSALNALGYDTFGGTSVSTQHHHIDPYALSFVPYWLRLSELTGNPIWRERALAAWTNGLMGVSDGSLIVMDKPRPAGSQDEGYLHTRWGNAFNVSQWLVAWPIAFRLQTLRRIRDWSVLGG